MDFFILAVEYKNFLETGLNNKFNHQLRPAQKPADLMKLYTQKKKEITNMAVNVNPKDPT